jgi:hypothetical protein
MDIVRGDWRFFWPENLSDFIGIPSAWDPSLNSGIGQSGVPLLWINSYLNFTASFSILGLSWPLIGYIFWLIPAVLGSFFSMFFLYRFFFPKQKTFAIFAGIIYVSNTYFLLLISGGQFGVALSYAVAPLVLLRFLILFRKQSVKTAILAGLSWSLLLLFDPRIMYVTLIALVILWLFQFTKPKKILRYVIFVVIIPVLLIVLLHSYWLFPIVLFRNVSVAAELGNLDSFKFFSFADFSHALAFLHPNWPENIFGKVYFLQPQFLLIPLIAFSSLIFVKRENKNVLLPLMLLVLFGAFLAKGVQEPFGFMNEIIYRHVPGMGMFRDPTKFYVLIALGYSVLIPIACYFFKQKILANRLKHFEKKYVYIVMFLWFLLLFSSVTLGNPINNLLPKHVPSEYVQLKNFFIAQPGFYRTVWIPKLQRYRYFSDTIPSSDLSDMTTVKPEELPRLVKDKKFQTKLQQFGVQYLIIPYDSESEIFLTDRKYDEKVYQKYVQTLNNTPWLHKEKQFGKIIVYKVSDAKGHFWLMGSGTNVSSKKLSSTDYVVKLPKNDASQILIFSERFDPNWIAKIDGNEEHSQKFAAGMNSFAISKGATSIEIYYAPQRFVNIGLIICLCTLLVSLFVLIRYRKL